MSTKILYADNMYIRVCNLLIVDVFDSQSEAICIGAYSKTKAKAPSSFELNFFLELEAECRSIRPDYYGVNNIQRLFTYLTDISENAKNVLSKAEKMQKGDVNKGIAELKKIHASLVEASNTEIADLLNEVISYNVFMFTEVERHAKKDH